MPANSVIIEDCIFEISPSYIAGAITCRNGGFYRSNPHRNGSQRESDWNDGYNNEADNRHVHGEIDVITAPRKGGIFDMNKQPRDENGDILNG